MAKATPNRARKLSQKLQSRRFDTRGLPRPVVRRIERAANAVCGHPSFVDRLPFVGLKRKGGERSFWCDVKSTGVMEQDQSLGSSYAYLALQAIKAEHFQPLLGWIVLDMIESRCPKHIVIGFFQTIADVALGIYKIPAAHMRLTRQS